MKGHKKVESHLKKAKLHAEKAKEHTHEAHKAMKEMLNEKPKKMKSKKK